MLNMILILKWEYAALMGEYWQKFLDQVLRFQLLLMMEWLEQI